LAQQLYLHQINIHFETTFFLSREKNRGKFQHLPQDIHIYTTITLAKVAAFGKGFLEWNGCYFL